MLGMVGFTSALVWLRDLLTYHGIRRRQGWQGRSTLRPIESICRNVPTRLKLRFTGGWEVNFFVFFSSFLSKRSELFFSYVIRYTFQSSLLLELILDLGKCRRRKPALSCVFWLGHFLRSKISSKSKFE